MTHGDAFLISRLTVRYGDVLALSDVTMSIPHGGVTALIGPSGCGKSTLLRTLNRMNDLVAGAHLTGTIEFDGSDIHAPGTDLVALRRRVGMVFQKPQPFPGSIRDNVAYGPRLAGRREGLDECVRRSLERAGLWDEVHDDLDRPAADLSGGQQQRMVIARCLALDPEVVLMDEPTASLDPIATAGIEALIAELARELTVVLVTHDLGQARRLADRTAFFIAHVHDDEGRHGELVEYGATHDVFGSPADPRTADYVRGHAP